MTKLNRQPTTTGLSMRMGITMPSVKDGPDLKQIKLVWRKKSIVVSYAGTTLAYVGERSKYKNALYARMGEGPLLNAIRMWVESDGYADMKLADFLKATLRGNHK